MLIWDLYNEPGNSQMGEKSLPLATAAFHWAREAEPQQPVTIGAWTSFDSRMSRALMEMSDVVSFHGYDEPSGVARKSRICRGYIRPVLCTEWLHRQSGNTFESILPILAVLFATTFWSFPREFWTPGEQLRRGEFSVSFQQTAKHAIIG